MLKLFLVPILVFLFVLFISMLMAGHMLVRAWHFLTMSPEARERAEEEYVRRTSQRNYKRGQQENDAQRFADDYFSRDTDFESEARQRTQQMRDEYRQATRTADGITIIDHRSQEEANRKIFSDDEGEYVQFEEDKH